MGDSPEHFADENCCLNEGLRGPADNGVDEHLLELVSSVLHLRLYIGNFLYHFLLVATQHRQDLGHHALGL